jgi:hypothetical protein
VIAPSSDNTPNAPLLIVTDAASTNAARTLDLRTIVRDTSSWLGYMHTWQWHDYVGALSLRTHAATTAGTRATPSIIADGSKVGAIPLGQHEAA